MLEGYHYAAIYTFLVFVSAISKLVIDCKDWLLFNAFYRSYSDIFIKPLFKDFNCDEIYLEGVLMYGTHWSLKNLSKEFSAGLNENNSFRLRLCLLDHMAKVAVLFCVLKFLNAFAYTHFNYVIKKLTIMTSLRFCSFLEVAVRNMNVLDGSEENISTTRAELCNAILVGNRTAINCLTLQPQHYQFYHTLKEWKHDTQCLKTIQDSLLDTVLRFFPYKITTTMVEWEFLHGGVIITHESFDERNTFILR